MVNTYIVYVVRVLASGFKIRWVAKVMRNDSLVAKSGPCRDRAEAIKEAVNNTRNLRKAGKL